MSEQLLKLASQMEAISAPDRDIDVAIVRALHPDIGRYAPHCSGEEPIFWEDPYRKQPAPKFTSSIDAAMALVPARKGWNVQGNTEIFYAVVAGHYSKACISPAIALCVSALRARAALSSHTEQEG